MRWPNCIDCGKELVGISKLRVKNNPNRRCMDCFRKTYKGWNMHGEGYIEVYVAPGIRKLKHRVVMEKILGRPLRRRETVHHRNEDRSDNRRKNLKLYKNPGAHVIEEGHVGRNALGQFASPDA